MTDIWVDTDFGFDDLWALLVLRHLNVKVAGVSLIAGNAPLAQVAANATAAKTEYGFDWPIWSGADRPLQRELETAERILGPTGMRSRGRQLDAVATKSPPSGALDTMQEWMQSNPNEPHEILALGPLTNIATLVSEHPDASKRINRLVWMGGSAGAGNHTPMAEFNAFADAEALVLVVASGIPLDIVDLTFCRKVTFGPNDLPDADPLTSDLLGGYLDIALERGRPAMAIYDPVAAVAMARPDSIAFDTCTVTVETDVGETYGATRVEPVASSHIRISGGNAENLSSICLRALERRAIHGQRL